MAAKSPVFPITEPHHFSDYGFDPQIDYFQVFGEAKRQHKRSEAYCFRSIDTLHFKLQKPFSRDKDDPFHHLSKKKNKKRRWWKNALLFFKSRWAHRPSSTNCTSSSSISGPIYITDPLTTGTASIPYVNLRELNMEQPHRIPAASPLPIYLVT